MRRALIVLLLGIHAGLLAWQAYRYSPTIDEPGHLVAGISHWKFGRFDLYRVNPPLVRLVAALPMLVVDPKTDWSAFTEAPYARPEFAIGTAFANANGFDTFWYFTLVRWACIPFSLIGGWYCYLWANALYGRREGGGKDSGFRMQDSGAGDQQSEVGDQRSVSKGQRTSTHQLPHTVTPPLPLSPSPPLSVSDQTTSPLAPRPSPLPGLMALTLWCFCPNILGNGTLITPDVAAASFGVAAGYHFWRWLRVPTWWNALFAGLALGLAELTKSSWIVLFALWPALWMAWLWCRRGKRLGVGGQGRGQDSGFRIRDSGNRGQTSAEAIDIAHTPPLSKGGAGGGAPDEDSRSGDDHSGVRIQDSGAGNQRSEAGDQRSVSKAQQASTPPLPLSPSPPLSVSDSRSTLLTPRAPGLKSSAAQLACVLALALYLLNLGYGFENSFQRLDRFAFISQSLGGAEAHEKPGNRFVGTWPGALPVPVPANYLRGIDVQKYDFEKKKWSYLRGEQKLGGWWYYYLYAMGVKMPVGTLFLLALTCVMKIWGVGSMIRGRALRCASRLNVSDDPLTTHNSAFTPISTRYDEVVLLAPAILLIFLVSSQTGFNRYLRYVVPAFPFLYIWISQLAAVARARPSPRETAASS